MKNYAQRFVRAVKPTDSQNFMSLLLIYPDNLINLPHGGILSLYLVFRIGNQKASGDPVAGITYLHTGDVLSRGSGGGYVPKLYTILLRF